MRVHPKGFLGTPLRPLHLCVEKSAFIRIMLHRGIIYKAVDCI
jgi:hypothetical protein